MRVLFTPHPSAQHLYPMVPLAWALRAAGHEVRVAAAPELAEPVRRAGLIAVDIGERVPDVYTMFTNTGLGAKPYEHRPFPPDWPLHPELLDDEQRTMIELLGRNSAVFAESTVDELVEFGRWWRPSLVVHDVSGLVGAVTAETLGLPNVRHLTGVGVRPMERRVGGTEPLPEFAALFDRRGLAVRCAPDLTVDPTPPSLRLPVNGPCAGSRYVPYNGPGAVPDWVEQSGDRPRVCVTWGIGASRNSRRYGPLVLEPCRQTLAALSEMDVEVLLTTMADQLELLGELPANVRPLVAVPLNLLLPHCALIVHQCGDGTALTAAALGVPQLPITSKPDPALTGQRLEDVGAAIHLRNHDLAGDDDAAARIRTAAEKMLADPAYAEAAARLRAENEQQPSPAALVSTLESIAGGDH
jgi:glycosyltransferase